MAETFEAYRTRALSYLGDEEPIAVQRATPSQLDRRLRDVAPEVLVRRPAPEKWSIAEIVAHLADAELWLTGGAVAYRKVALARAYSPQNGSQLNTWGFAPGYDRVGLQPAISWRAMVWGRGPAVNRRSPAGMTKRKECRSSAGMTKRNLSLCRRFGALAAGGGVSRGLKPEILAGF
jgi:hypothetical protein